MKKGQIFSFSELSPSFLRTREVLRQGVEKGVFPGAVVGIWTSQSRREAGVYAIGQRRLTPSAQPMEVHTLMDISSVSKIYATSTLVALLVQRGWLDWDTPVASVISNYPYPDIRVRHLLAHTAGLPAWKPFYEDLRKHFAPWPLERISVRERQAKMRELVFAVPPETPVETRALYSDLSFLTLGFLLEDLLQRPLDQAVERELWAPLGLKESFYFRTTASAADGRVERAAATEHCPWRGAVLQGQVHDDNCWAMGGYSGHSGVFATVHDLLRFVSALHDGFFESEILHKMWARADRPVGCDRTLGWDTPAKAGSSVGRLCSSQTVGHLGFTGTSLWIDLSYGLAIILLTNRVHPARDNQRIKEFRPAFHEAVYQDFGIA